LRILTRNRLLLVQGVVRKLCMGAQVLLEGVS